MTLNTKLKMESQGKPQTSGQAMTTGLLRTKISLKGGTNSQPTIINPVSTFYGLSAELPRKLYLLCH